MHTSLEKENLQFYSNEKAMIHNESELKNPIYFETPRLRKFYENNLSSVEQECCKFLQFNNSKSSKQQIKHLIASPFCLVSSSKKQIGSFCKQQACETKFANFYQESLNLINRCELPQSRTINKIKLSLKNDKNVHNANHRQSNNQQHKVIQSMRNQYLPVKKIKKNDEQQQPQAYQSNQIISMQLQSHIEKQTTSQSLCITPKNTNSFAIDKHQHQQISLSETTPHSENSSGLSNYDRNQDTASSIENKKRRRKTNQQVQILNDLYSQDASVWSKEKIMQVARMAKLTEAQVYKWCWDQKKKLYEEDGQGPTSQQQFQFALAQQGAKQTHQTCKYSNETSDNLAGTQISKRLFY